MSIGSKNVKMNLDYQDLALGLQHQPALQRIPGRL